MLDALVKEFGLKLAIHNHGPEDKVWPSPLDVWRPFRSMTSGSASASTWAIRPDAASTPSRRLRTCAGRLYDLHFKDLTSKDRKVRPVEVGRGVLDVRGMLKRFSISATLTMSASSTRKT